MRRYSDEQLVAALAASRSWRGVLRALGLAASSASAMRSVRRHAGGLGLDYAHFTGQRRWTEQQLTEAVASGSSRTEVANTLGLSGGSSTVTLRGHAARLGLDTTHLLRHGNSPAADGDRDPRLANLGRAGSLMAAAWFELCGHAVSWPLEPCRYDLLVWRGARAERIQVKTGTVRTGTAWTVWLSKRGRQRTPYDPDDVDQFFVIDGNLDYYLIPMAAVGGLMSIQTSAYRQYSLPRLADA